MSETSIPNSVSDECLLVSVPRAARMLDISRSKLYELLGAGDIPSVHIGRSVRIPLGALQAFVAQRLEG